MINMADFKELCPHSEFCGGCIHQGTPYEEQLKEEINADRAAHGKKPIKDKNDDELMAFIVEQLEKRAPHYSKAQYSFRADKLEDTVQVKASAELSLSVF